MSEFKHMRDGIAQDEVTARKVFTEQYERMFLERLDQMAQELVAPNIERGGWQDSDLKHLLPAVQQHIESMWKRYKHVIYPGPLPLGTVIKSIRGETDDDDLQERKTGLNAEGVIIDRNYYQNRGWTYGVTFKNGTTVFLDEYDDLGGENYPIVSQPERP